MSSMQSKVFRSLLRVFSKNWNSVNNLRKSLKGRENAAPPWTIRRKFVIEEKVIQDSTVYTMKPRLVQQDSTKHIVYLHGGGYVHEMSPFHWVFLDKLMEDLDCTITVPIYPLATKQRFDHIFSFVLDVYEQLLHDIQPENMTLMGDSAGGGMALALAQLIREKNLSQPRHIIMFSPFLDVTLSSPEVKALEKQDPMLALPGMKEAGRMYAGGADPRNYLISPIYGTLEELGQITIFVGTDEILLADAQRLKKRAIKQKININYFEYPAMFHAWPIFPIPETKKTILQIKAILEESEENLS